MGAKRNACLGLLTALAFVASGLGSASAQETGPGTAETIDYAGFLRLAEDVEAIRAGRLVTLDVFNRMAREPGTIILDTRSAAAFAAGHIEGAVNLPFSEFTDEKLAAVIASADTRILIYCNNNFSDDIAPVMIKRVELALNVPTFINLYGYGYENIYELGDQVRMDMPEVRWVGERAPL